MKAATIYIAISVNGVLPPLPPVGSGSPKKCTKINKTTTKIIGSNINIFQFTQNTQLFTKKRG